MICPLLRTNATDWAKNLNTITEWSPFSSEGELFTQVRTVICFGVSTLCSTALWVILWWSSHLSCVCRSMYFDLEPFSLIVCQCAFPRYMFGLKTACDCTTVLQHDGERHQSHCLQPLGGWARQNRARLRIWQPCKFMNSASPFYLRMAQFAATHKCPPRQVFNVS